MDKGLGSDPRTGKVQSMGMLDDLSLTEDVLSRAADDWLTAAEVIDVSRRSGLTDPSDLRDLSVGLIARLVFGGLLVPGEFDGKSHRAWECSPAQAVQWVSDDWAARDDPFVMPGEIVWLAASSEGKSRGEDVLRRLTK